uniref:Uncharacterized protein LOC104237179 n=1 Tax=Nicotiana sylvestris TaxID=4096 RepID=A0A1U7XRQ4_NICSY|nr:PREDICTED: uncharacterized protein LOC104237179 [Nicotiana sylvestris]
MAFARLLAQIIRLRAQFPDYAIKTIRFDNAGEFTSQAFIDYCMAIGIKVEHPVVHVHTQNSIAKSLIKHLQLIARPLLMRTKLPLSVWGHAILHASALVTKSYIPAVNAPIRVDVPNGQYDDANESRPRLKRGRSIGSKDKNP